MDSIPIHSQFCSPHGPVRWAAVEFASEHPDCCAHLAVPLVTAAGDPSDAVAMLAADALERLGPPPKTALPELLALLRANEDGEMAFWAVTLIGRLGPDAASATEALCEQLLKSPFLPVRERAAWALARIGAAAASSAVALRIAADGGPPRLTRLATQALESVRGMAA